MFISTTNLSGEVYPPPSKSVSHRALILSSLAEEGTSISNVLLSEDVKATYEGLTRMGTEFTEFGNRITQLGGIRHGSAVINCYNSGTTMRLLTGIVSLFPEETTLIGDESLLKRPMQPLIDALTQLGAEITSIDGCPPITVKLPIRNFYTTCKIDGSVSSQFISSLLILASIRGSGIDTKIELTSPLISRPYVELTQQMLKNLNVEIMFQDNTIIVTGKDILPKFEITIPSDFSSAAFYLVAGAFPGNNIIVKNMINEYTQADSKIIEFLKLAGAKIEIQSDDIIVKHGNLKAFSADIGDCPDLFPILCVLAVACKGTSKIYGAKHLVHKETNRIQSMAQNLEKLGVPIRVLQDGAEITGTQIKGGIELNSFGDHRIAMACGILSTLSKKGCTIINPECVSVSYPDFFETLKSLSR